MVIFGGFQKTSLVDFPGRVASIVFVAGCNMRCHYCYNPDLVFRKTANIAEDDILSALESRKRLIDAVVVTGGEPTIWQDLPGFLGRLQGAGMHVKLDTNGTNPEMLETIISSELAEYVAMDIKAPWGKYAEIAGVQVDVEKVKRSAGILKEGRIDYEFRTTVAPGLGEADMMEIGEQIAPARRWFIQEFLPKEKILDPAVNSLPRLRMSSLHSVSEKLKPVFAWCALRD
jgi:pyruvate formate lyase activating enzyme